MARFKRCGTVAVWSALGRMLRRVRARACSLLAAAATVAASGLVMAEERYQVGFATYLGGAREGQVRDVAVDRAGNVYVAGGTGSPDFLTTLGPKHQGSYDVFVVKYSPQGKVIWSRLVGGPNYDRAYAIEVDGQGHVYLGGRAGPGYPTTAGAVQPRFGGHTGRTGLYGQQDGFITKLSPDGARILWSTFIGASDGGFFRDIDIDQEGNVYGAMCDCSVDNPQVTAGAFLAKRPPGVFGMVIKVAADGSRVVWASYLGGTDGERGIDTPSIRVDAHGCPVLATHVLSRTMPTTAGAYDRTFNGRRDFYVAKFSADGSRLIFGTYLGGSEVEYGDTHNLALDRAGNIIVAATTKSADFPVTASAYQRVFGGAGGEYNQKGDGFIAKLSPDGTRLLAATFYGGRSGEGLEGVACDAEGNVYVTGGTYSPDMPVSPGGRRPAGLGPHRPEAYAAKFSPDLSRLLFGTCLGGGDWDLGLAAAVTDGGVFYLTGETKSRDFPVVRPAQGRLAGAKNGLVVQFQPVGVTPASAPAQKVLTRILERAIPQPQRAHQGAASFECVDLHGSRAAATTSAPAKED